MNLSLYVPVRTYMNREDIFDILYRTVQYATVSIILFVYVEPSPVRVYVECTYVARDVKVQ